ERVIDRLRSIFTRRTGLDRDRDRPHDAATFSEQAVRRSRLLEDIEGCLRGLDAIARGGERGGPALQDLAPVLGRLCAELVGDLAVLGADAGDLGFCSGDRGLES